MSNKARESRTIDPYKMRDDLSIDGCESLVQSIVMQAVKDYRKALKKIAKNPHNRSALYTKREIEEFFRSEYFSILTDLDPEMLIRRLQEEMRA